MCAFILMHMVIAWHTVISANAAIDLAVKSYELFVILTVHDTSVLNRMTKIIRSGIVGKHFLTNFINGVFFCCSISIRSIDDMKRWLFCKTLNLAISGTIVVDLLSTLFFFLKNLRTQKSLNSNKNEFLIFFSLQSSIELELRGN